MKDQIDEKIKEKFMKDNYIPDKIDFEINKIIEQNRTINFDKNENIQNDKIKNIFFVKKLLGSLTILIVAIFLGVNMYAYATGKNNIFSMVAQKLNINNSEYEEQKIILKKDSDKKLDLLEYAYNDEILILNYIYNAKEDIEDYKDITTEEDFEKFGIYEKNAEYPSFVITNSVQKISEGKYGIFKVLDMNYLKKEKEKINIYVTGVIGSNYEDKDKIEQKFVLDVSNKSKNQKQYKLDDKILEFNIDQLKQKIDVVTPDDLDEPSMKYFSDEAEKDNKLRDKIYEEYFKDKVKMVVIDGIQRIKIEKIINTNFCSLIYLDSYISLQKIGRDDDRYLNEYCPGYTFEITNKNGEVLCTRDSENLQLDPESGESSGILMINSIPDNDKTINIKVYEEITGGLIAKKTITLK